MLLTRLRKFIQMKARSSVAILSCVESRFKQVLVSTSRELSTSYKEGITSLECSVRSSTAMSKETVFNG